MTLPVSETIDHPRKSKENTQNTDSHNTIKLEQPTQLERTITTPQKIKDLAKKKKHKSLRKIKQWIRIFFLRKSNIQYAVTSTSFIILLLTYDKCICNTGYTLSKGLGRDKLAMSCTYSFSFLVENMKWVLLMLLVFLF